MFKMILKAYTAHIHTHIQIFSSSFSNACIHIYFIHWFWCLHFESDSKLIQYMELIIMADSTDFCFFLFIRQRSSWSVLFFFCSCRCCWIFLSWYCCSCCHAFIPCRIIVLCMRVWTIRKFVLLIKWMNSL